MTESAAVDTFHALATRAQWACGLCFALFILMGLSGVASVTLLYAGPPFVPQPGTLESWVIGAVSTLEPAIRFIHGYGGYVGIVLAGWACVEVFSCGRIVRASADTRPAGTGLIAVAVLAGLLLVGGVLAQLATGVGAAAFLRLDSMVPGEGRPDPSRLSENEPVRPGQQSDPQLVEWHTRELNYSIAAGALMLAWAASVIRREKLKRKPRAEARGSDEAAAA